jgi:hypothetical protein
VVSALEALVGKLSSFVARANNRGLWISQRIIDTRRYYVFCIILQFLPLRKKIHDGWNSIQVPIIVECHHRTESNIDRGFNSFFFPIKLNKNK